jgi:hypothetical protein
MILGRYEKMLDEQERAGGMKLVEATSQASGESRPVRLLQFSNITWPTTRKRRHLELGRRREV